MPDVPTIPVSRWVDAFINFLEANFQFVFDLITAVSETLVGWVASALQFPPPLVLAVLLAALGVWLRSWSFGAFALAALLLIQGMGLWEETILTLALIAVATVVAVLIGLPVGILASRNSTVSTAVRPVLDFMQTLPVFVYVVLGVAFFSIGTTPGLIATLVFATPPGVRLTELGIRQVDPEVVEAAQAFGAGRNQILTRVQVPLALPSIMQGVNQVIMLALSMVVVAGLVGTPGLGNIIVLGISSLQIGLAVEGGLAVVIIAIYLDRITGVLKDRVAAAT